MALFRDNPNEPVQEEIFFWTVRCEGKHQRQTHLMKTINCDTSTLLHHIH